MSIKIIKLLWYFMDSFTYLILLTAHIKFSVSPELTRRLKNINEYIKITGIKLKNVCVTAVARNRKERENVTLASVPVK